MIKKLSNIKGVTIDTNGIIDGTSAVYHNEDTYEIKNGKTMLVKFSNFSLSSITKIGKAKMILPVYGYGTFELLVFRNLGEPYDPEMVNGLNEPLCDETVYHHYEKFTIGKSGGALEQRNIEIDLTALFTRWKNDNEDNLSMTIKCNSTATLNVYGFTNEDLDGVKVFELTYADTSSFSSAFDYLTDEVAFGGKALINTYTGRLSHQFDVFQTNSKKFPIKFAVNYHDRSSGITMKNSLLGRWRTNFDFGFRFETDTITVASPEGSVAYYEKILKEEAAKYGISLGLKPHCFINFIDNSYIVLDGIVNGIQHYKMHDSMGTVYDFNENNQILKITKTDGDYINLTYNTSFQVVSITSNDGYQVTLSYNGSSIHYVNFIEEDKRVEITYTSSSISKIKLQQLIRTVTYTGTVITYQDLISTSFVHTSTTLTRVTNDKTLEGVKFDYKESKVIRITNTIKNGTTYINGSYRDLSYEPAYTKISDHDANVQYLTHDNFGMLLQTIDNDGNSQSRKYQTVGMDNVARRLSDDSGWISNAKSQILDPSFELVESEGLSTSSLGWKTNATSEYVKLTSKALRGKSALQIKGGNNVQVYQNMSALPKSNFTISFFAKTISLSGVGEVNLNVTYRKKVVVSIIDVLNGAHYDIQEGNTYYVLVTTGFTKKVDVTNTDGKWELFEIQDILMIDFYELLSARLTIKGIHSSGDMVIDAFRINSDEHIVNHNMLISTDMETTTGVPSGFVKNSICTSLDTIISNSMSLPYSKIIGNKCFRFTNTSGLTKSIEREIALKGSSGESFTLAFWGKSEFNQGSELKGKVLFKKGTEIVQTVEVTADKSIFNWQLVSTSLLTKRPFDSFKIIIEYTGVNLCLIDTIGLYRDNLGVHYNYNEKGNLLEEADHASSKSLKTDGSKIVESNDESGEQYKYSYDTSGKVSRVIDSKGNSIDLEYDENGNRTKSKITSNSKTLELSNTFNADDQVETTTDELGNVTQFTYDSLKRLKTRTEANGLVTTNSYDELNNLLAIVKTGSGNTMSAMYEYYDNNSLKKIIAENGTTYEFIYDGFGRVLEIKLNSTSFVAYEYGLENNSVTLDNVTKQTIGLDVYTFTYDSKRRLREIKLNEVSLVTYEYDNDSNVAKKTVGSEISYFDYDSKGKLVRETRKNGETLAYDYDNLGQLQKAIFDLNGMKRTYDFEYLNEYNEYNKENVVTRIDKAFNDEIIDYNALVTGLYGARVDSAWGFKTSYGDKKVFRLNKMTSKIIYPLNTVNSTRTINNMGGVFDKKAWQAQFNVSKSMFGWFRFTGTIGSDHRILAFGNDTTDQYYVTLTKLGSIFQFKLYCGSTFIRNVEISATSELIFIGLRLFRGGVNQTSYVFTVNNEDSTGVISTSNYIFFLSKFVIGNRTITSGSTIANPFVQEVALISIGAYPYTSAIFQRIQSEQNKFQNMVIKPKTGVSFINQKTYENFEVMSLNGTFKSTNGRIPTDYEFIDGTFKLDKTKLFKYDELLERHVYGSYSAAQGFGLVKGLLAYQHELSNQGTISINFKMEGEVSSNRTIFEFNDAGSTKLKAYRSNSSGFLTLMINDTPWYTTFPVPLNQWNRILVTFDGQSPNSLLRIYLNGSIHEATPNLLIGVTNSKLIIGSSLLTDGTPTEHLDGVLEMLAFQNSYLGGNTTEINRIIYGEQQLSVKTEIDVMGRSYKDIIDTGIPEANLQTTKKLVSEYAYKSPGLNKTSLQVSAIQGFDGINKEYSYDSMGNITKIKVINAEDTNDFHEFEYICDKLSRLKEEYNPITEQTIVYTHGLNNNISTVTHHVGRKISIIKTETYIYDVNYKDQLNEIQTIESGITTTKTITYNSNRVPTSFLGKTLDWQGRRLTSINGEDFKYYYNDAGIRTSKVVNNVTTKYHLIGDRVGSLTKGSNKLFFHYNERDMLVGLEYDKENYFYSRDLTGNITSIVDKNGLIMVEYQYDAWGRWLNQATAAKTSIGTTLLSLNPFLYKGYIYDEESGFYYLKSRYYSTEVKRFISDDDISYLDHENIYKLNLYAYCGNNPITRVDYSGHDFWDILLHIGSALAVVGGVVLMFVPGAQILGLGLIGFGIGSFIGGNISEMNGRSFAAGWLIGGALGFGLGVGIGYFAPALGTFMQSSFTFGGLALAGGGTYGLITLTGAQISGLVLAGSGILYFSTQRMGPGRHSNNQSENQFIDYLQKKYKFSDKVRRQLHDEITGQGYTRKIIEEILKAILGL